MDIGHYVRSEHDLLVLAAAQETPLGRAEDYAFAQRIEQEELRNRKRPKRVTDGDLSEDIVYRLGFAAGLAWRTELLESARQKARSE